jgi:hypothetical protein
MREVDLDLEPFAVGIPMATNLTGISHSRLYELIRSTEPNV